MHMYFWWSSVVEDFLFYGYNIKSVGGLISTCFGLMAIAVIFEWLKLLQARLRQKELFLRAKQLRSICPPSESSMLLFSNRRMVDPVNITLCYRITLFLWDLCIWLNLQVLGYLLMLAVMVYNGWMVISLILGSATGYFLFGPSFSKLNLQNCQIIQETFCSLNCNEPEPQDGETTPALGASTSAVFITKTPSQVSVCVHAEHSESL